jgi:membrane-bound lytic murein transglycosylase D
MDQKSIIVNVITEGKPLEGLRFTASFCIGRSKGCDLVIKHEVVSRKHVLVAFDGGKWFLKDLESGNGTFINGVRVHQAELAGSLIIELGHGGPQISLQLEVTSKETKQKREAEATAQPQLNAEPVVVTVPLSGTKACRPEFATETQVIQHHLASENAGEQPPGYERPHFATETQVIRHYFDTPKDEPVGDQTMMIRRAFSREHKAKSKKYRFVIGVALLLLIAAGGFIQYQKMKLEKMQATAQNIFYMMKSQELQIVRLEDMVFLTADPKQLADLSAKREKFKGMEKEYDSFIKELGIYGKLPDEDKVIMKVARIFGECELTMPKGFAGEVKRYISLWKSSDRLKSSLALAQEKGYAAHITKLLSDNNLPPQFIFLALQESNFNERAVGPLTRYGCAKGMWQFITPTADNYGLHIGPLYDQGVYDPLDERFDFRKASVAATKYLKELNSTNAQASGLLVLASYNWGEDNVRKAITRMPENPRERNFWRLLELKKVPKETYDYVLLIFAAAVICENPQLFGFDGVCPACR